jgi:hypothetical protein
MFGMSQQELAIIIRLKDYMSGALAKTIRHIKWWGKRTLTTVNKIKKALLSVQGIMLGVFGAMLVRRIVGSFVKVGGELERFRVQMLAVHEMNYAAAESALKVVRKYAKMTPHMTRDVIQAYIRLRAVGINVTEQILDRVGNVAFVFGRNITDIARAVISLHSRVLQRLGVQIHRAHGEATIMSRNFKVTVKNDATEIRNALLQVWERYGKAMTVAQSSFEGLVAIMKSAWWELQADIMDAGVLDYIKAMVIVLIDKFTEWGDSASDTGGKVIWVLENVVLALGAVATLIQKAWALVVGAGYIATKVWKGYLDLVLKSYVLHQDLARELGVMLGKLPSQYAGLVKPIRETLGTIVHGLSLAKEKWKETFNYDEVTKNAQDLKDEFDRLWTAQTMFDWAERFNREVRPIFEKLLAGAKLAKGIQDAKKELNAFGKAIVAVGGLITANLIRVFDDLVDNQLKPAHQYIKAILRDVANFFIRQALGELWKGLAGLIGSVAGAAAGGAGGGIGGAVGSAAGHVATSEKLKMHSGGLVPAWSGSYGGYPPSLWRGAPRFHGGLSPDEFPAILQRGERVLSKEQASGGGGGDVHLHLDGVIDGDHMLQTLARNKDSLRIMLQLLRAENPNGI